MNDIIRSTLVVVAVLGVLAVAFGAYRYWDGTQDLNNLPEFDPESQEDIDRLDNPTNAQIIALSEARRRDARLQRYYGLVIGGAGLVGVGLAWFGWDIVSRKPQSMQPAD